MHVPITHLQDESRRLMWKQLALMHGVLQWLSSHQPHESLQLLHALWYTHHVDCALLLVSWSQLLLPLLTLMHFIIPVGAH